MPQKTLSTLQKEELLKTLKSRFDEFIARHTSLDWTKIQKKLESSPEKLLSLNEMERTGGQPDTIGFDTNTGEYIFFDCSPETPKDRRSLCYDRSALEARKSFPPKSSALDMCSDMGVTLMNEEQYRQLQELGEFDSKTSSWLLTPPAIRKLGGAIFADRRYDHVFIYHNGADSYYAVRGFRSVLLV